jgi:hypothetical protein
MIHTSTHTYTHLSGKDWILQVSCLGKGFTAPKTLTVPKGQTAAVEVGFTAPKAGHYAAGRVVGGGRWW